MAKPKKGKTGIWTIRACLNRKRCTLTLGQMDIVDARLFASQLNALIAHRKHNEHGIPTKLQSWVDSLTARHIEQLVGIGLIDRFTRSLTVKQLIKLFLEDYELKDVENSTKTQFRTSMRRFPEWFKRKSLSELEPKRRTDRIHAKPVFPPEVKRIFKRVESWQREHYALSSWSRGNGRLREVGVWAVEQGICDYNPFSLLPCPKQRNPERNVYVPTEWVEDAAAMSIDDDTRLCFILGRYAGLRLPSEARTMKWSHVDREGATLTIIDSKKKRPRKMPLFQRIREALDSIDQVGTFVMSTRFLSNSGTNNYQLMAEAVARTEWTRWEKLCQNLRSSCENDLLNAGFDERQVTAWLGHTIQISREHYQHETEADRVSAIARAPF